MKKVVSDMTTCEAGGHNVGEDCVEDDSHEGKGRRCDDERVRAGAVLEQEKGDFHREGTKSSRNERGNTEKGTARVNVYSNGYNSHRRE